MATAIATAMATAITSKQLVYAGEEVIVVNINTCASTVNVFLLHLWNPGGTSFNTLHS